jgi:hypothetical protein
MAGRREHRRPENGSSTLATQAPIALRGATIEHGLETLFGPVIDVNRSTVAFLLDFEALHWPLHDRQAINQRLGGMSGGPVFRLVEEGLTRLEFVGTVYEHGPTFELVFARSAAVIRADGTLAA